MGRLKEADQYLSQAQWSVLKTPDCDPWLKSRLHRNLGQLAAAKNLLAEARRHFAEDVCTLLLFGNKMGDNPLISYKFSGILHQCFRYLLYYTDLPGKCCLQSLSLIHI